MSKIKKLMIATLTVTGAGSLAIVGFLSAGAVAGTVAGSPTENRSDATPSARYPISTNEHEETFGSVLGSAADMPPDLILVVGDSGKEGYVRSSDYFGEAPSSPEEALAQMKRDQESPPVIDVYLSDGKTKFDTFTFSPSDAGVSDFK